MIFVFLVKKPILLLAIVLDPFLLILLLLLLLWMFLRRKLGYPQIFLYLKNVSLIHFGWVEQFIRSIILVTMNKIEGTLMEVVKDKPYTFAGKSGVSSSLLFRPKGQNTRIMKFKGNTDDKTLWSDATELLDKEVVIGFDLFPGEGMAASVRLVSISEA